MKNESFAEQSEQLAAERARQDVSEPFWKGVESFPYGASIEDFVTSEKNDENQYRDRCAILAAACLDKGVTPPLSSSDIGEEFFASHQAFIDKVDLVIGNKYYVLADHEGKRLVRYTVTFEAWLKPSTSDGAFIALIRDEMSSKALKAIVSEVMS